MLPVRKTPRLDFGRISNPEATYFITLVTKRRVPVLITNHTGRILATSLEELHMSGDIRLLAATIMPDHTHLLFTLGRRLNLGQVMGKLKTRARESGRTSWRWQKNAFEHQVRRHESIEDYAFYIFMNPYRAALCSLGARWPWWICPKPEMLRFMDSLGPQDPVPNAWLRLSDEIFKTIASGD